MEVLNSIQFQSKNTKEFLNSFYSYAHSWRIKEKENIKVFVISGKLHRVDTVIKKYKEAIIVIERLKERSKYRFQCFL